MTNKQFKILVAVVIILLFIGGGVKLWDSFTSSQIRAKVIDTQQQMIVEQKNGQTSTRYRYLVVTDRGTFVCESSLINGKFNNSELFYSLKKDSTYNFELQGIGKTLLTDYKNIISYTK